MISSGVFTGVLFSVQQITPFPALLNFKENLPVHWHHSPLLFSLFSFLSLVLGHDHLSKMFELWSKYVKP